MVLRLWVIAAAVGASDMRDWRAAYVITRPDSVFEMLNPMDETNFICHFIRSRIREHVCEAYEAETAHPIPSDLPIAPCVDLLNPTTTQ